METGNGYNESDTVGVSNLNIEADAGQSPVLDGTTPTAQSSPGFTIEAGTTGVTIEGFTIQNFTGTSAVAVQNGASLTLSGDTIQDNTNSGGNGGGINVNNGGTLTITGGTLTDNTATQRRRHLQHGQPDGVGRDVQRQHRDGGALRRLAVRGRRDRQLRRDRRS